MFVVFKEFAMTKAEQVRPTPVVLTRRDSLKRGAAALVRRRNLASSTVATVAPADPAELRPLEANGTSDGVRTAVEQFTTSGSRERIPGHGVLSLVRQ
jgi:hypothetical protein